MANPKPKQITFVLTDHYDVADGVSILEVLGALNDINEKVRELGTVDRLMANLPEGEVDLTELA